MRHQWIAAALLTFGLSLPAHADDASRLKIARDVVETAHAAENMRKLFPQLMAQMRPMLMQQGADPKMVDIIMQQFLQKTDKSVDAFADLAAKVYAKEFSEEDLSNLLAFYQTPSGQHLVAKQAEITQGMMAVGMQWGQNMAKEVLEEYQRQKTVVPPKT